MIWVSAAGYASEHIVSGSKPLCGAALGEWSEIGPVTQGSLASKMSAWWDLDDAAGAPCMACMQGAASLDLAPQA